MASTRASYTLLGLLAALVVWLGAEAIRSVEEQRRNADRVLTEYAGLAAWYFRSAWRAEWTAQAKAALGSVAGTPLARADDSLPGLGPLLEGSRAFAFCGGPGPDTLRFAFRYDRRDGTLHTMGAPVSPRRRRALVDSLRQLPSLAPLELAAFLGESPRRLVFTAQKPGPDGHAVASYGFEACAEAVGAETFRRVFAASPLLPSSRLEGIPNDSVVSMVVTRGREGEPGDTLFASRPAYPGVYRSRIVERPGQVSMIFEAHLRPALARLLVPGGLPQTRAPWLILLLVTTLGLMLQVVRQIRRERQLASARADFVTSVSHELRTPLAQIRLFAESLRLGSPRSERERMVAVEVILQESQRLMNLVENVLHFARRQRGGRTPFPERVDLSALARQTVEGFEPLTRSRNIRFRLELEEPVPVQVEPGPTRQILLNLLDNATKFGPEGSTVTVRTWQEAGWANLAVEDQGPGIPTADRSRIWEPFVRLKANPVRAPGSGIGLAVVRDLVARQDGQVRVEAAPRGGARFLVRFPATPTVPRPVLAG